MAKYWFEYIRKRMKAHLEAIVILGKGQPEDGNLELQTCKQDEEINFQNRLMEAKIFSEYQLEI